MDITGSQSNAIDYLRVIAMFCIIACHVCQYYENKWAWVLNTGVQIFIVISGFLYGIRFVDDWVKWFKKRFCKLYIPFLLYILIVFPLYYIFKREYLKPYSLLIYLLDLQGMLGGVKGLGHLWYMTAIAMCYLTTPFLQWVGTHCKNQIILLLFIVLIALFDFLYMAGLFYPICLYAISYYLAQREVKLIRIILLVIAVIAVLIVLRWNFLPFNLGFDKSLMMIVWRSLMGLLVFSAFLFFSSFVEFGNNKGVAIMSKYSYHIYIVHHLPILLPFSILAWNVGIITKVILLGVTVIASCILLYKASEKICALVKF